MTETAKPIAADRERLPNRRELLSLNDDGRLAEVFLTAAKSGTAIDAVAGHEALEGAVERASASARPRQSKRLISRSSSRNCLMPRRPASVTQADIARAIRAARQEGAAEVEVRVGPATILVRMTASPSTGQETVLEQVKEIVL